MYLSFTFPNISYLQIYHSSPNESRGLFGQLTVHLFPKPPHSFVVEVEFFHKIRFLMQSCVCDWLSHPYLYSFLSLFGPLDALCAAGKTVFRSCCAWWPLPENVISGSNGGIKEKKKNDNTVEGQILIVLLRELGFRQAECKNLLQALSSSEILWARKQRVWGEDREGNMPCISFRDLTEHKICTEFFNSAPVQWCLVYVGKSCLCPCKSNAPRRVRWDCGTGEYFCSPHIS